MMEVAIVRQLFKITAWTMVESELQPADAIAASKKRRISEKKDPMMVDLSADEAIAGASSSSCKAAPTTDPSLLPEVTSEEDSDSDDKTIVDLTF